MSERCPDPNCPGRFCPEDYHQRLRDRALLEESISDRDVIARLQRELKNARAATEVAIHEHAQEVSKLRQWVRELQSGLYLNCVFCGENFTGQENFNRLTNHIRECPEHPLSRLLTALWLYLSTHDRADVQCMSSWSAQDHRLLELWKLTDEIGGRRG